MAQQRPHETSVTTSGTALRRADRARRQSGEESESENRPEPTAGAIQVLRAGEPPEGAPRDRAQSAQAIPTEAVSAAEAHFNPFGRSLSTLEMVRALQRVSAENKPILDKGFGRVREETGDLRMPKWQLVEFYTPLKEQEAAKKAGVHQQLKPGQKAEMCALCKQDWSWTFQSPRPVRSLGGETYDATCGGLNAADCSMAV